MLLVLPLPPVLYLPAGAVVCQSAAGLIVGCYFSAAELPFVTDRLPNQVSVLPDCFAADWEYRAAVWVAVVPLQPPVFPVGETYLWVYYYLRFGQGGLAALAE